MKTFNIFYFNRQIIENVTKILQFSSKSGRRCTTTDIFKSESIQHQAGDINGDALIDIIDIILCANQILNMYTLQPLEFLAAYLDANGIIDLYDILKISELMN